jgi:hypothetical protein
MPFWRYVSEWVGRRKTRSGAYEDHLRDEGVVDAGSCEDGGAIVEEVL